jgi:hypothetical protein
MHTFSPRQYLLELVPTFKLFNYGEQPTPGFSERARRLAVPRRHGL